MLVYWVCSNERAASIDYLVNGANTKLVNPALEGYNTTIVGLAIMIAGSLTAFFFNLSTYYFVSYTSALTSTIGANLVKVILIVAAAIEAGVHDIVSWSGVALVVSSIGLYVYLSYKPPPSAAEREAFSSTIQNGCGKGGHNSGKGDAHGAQMMSQAAPSETTPLKGSSTV